MSPVFQNHCKETLQGEGTSFLLTIVLMPLTSSGSLLPILSPVLGLYGFPLPVHGMFGVFYRKLPLTSASHFVSHSETHFSSLCTPLYSLLLLMLRLWSSNLNCFCPSPPSSALASSPWFSPEFPYHLPSTTPHPPVDSPDISVKTRFFSSAGLQGLCQVSLGLQSVTHLLGRHLLAHL